MSLICMMWKLCAHKCSLLCWSQDSVFWCLVVHGFIESFTCIDLHRWNCFVTVRLKVRMGVLRGHLYRITFHWIAKILLVQWHTPNACCNSVPEAIVCAWSLQATMLLASLTSSISDRPAFVFITNKPCSAINVGVGQHGPTWLHSPNTCMLHVAQVQETSHRSCWQLTSASLKPCVYVSNWLCSSLNNALQALIWQVLASRYVASLKPTALMHNSIPMNVSGHCTTRSPPQEPFSIVLAILVESYASNSWTDQFGCCT